jgi:flagellar biosynthetic protein FlhB
MASREGKTEAPTPKRKKDARKKGGRPKSPDLSGWATLLTCTYVVPSTIHSVQKVVMQSLLTVGTLADQPDAHDVVPALGAALQGGFFAAMPILLVCLLVGTLTHFGQTGLVLSLHPLKPDFKRINPVQGVKKLFSMRSVWETGKQIAKGIAIAWVARPHIESITARLTNNGRVGLGQGLSASITELVAMIRGTCWVILIIAIIDYGYQRRQHMRDLKMTKQEVRDEMRNSEGDPQVKQRIRAMQGALAMNRMMSSIGDATVVITNPTHIAIAVRYNVADSGAPKIVAAGVGALAARIRERAHAAGIPIVESKPLARALWRSCDVGEEIPIALYEAVAKVLAFVRRLRGGVLAASALPLPGNYDVERTVLDSIPTRRHRRQSV